MKKHLLYIFFAGIISCNFFTSEKDIKETLIREEIQRINWNELDQYPMFDTCDETADKATQKACFETTFIHHFKRALQKHQITVRESIDDTVWMNLRVDHKGRIIVSNIEKSKKTMAEIPQLDSIFNHSISLLPKLYPPLKRDIPVMAKFRIPIVFHME